MSTAPFAAPLYVPRFYSYLASGAPNNGGSVLTQVGGTSVNLTTYPTYADALAGTNPNANPVVLDSAGSANIWAQNVSLMKITVKDSGGATLYTSDNIPVAQAWPGNYGTNAEWVQELNPIAFTSATSFTTTSPVDLTAIYHTGRRIKTQNTGGTVYGTIVSSAFGGASTTVTVVCDGAGVIDSGLSFVAYGQTSYNNPSYLSPRTALHVNKNGNQTNFLGANTKITTWNVINDPLSEWDNANNQWVPKYAGRYLVTAVCEAQDTGVSQALLLNFLRGATAMVESRSASYTVASTTQSTYPIMAIVNIAVAGAANAITLCMTGTANTTVIGGIGTAFSIERIP